MIAAAAASSFFFRSRQSRTLTASRLSASRLLNGELEIMGSRAFTTQEIVESLELCARGEVWPLVTETYRLEDAEKVHARLEAGAITGRAAIVMD